LRRDLLGASSASAVLAVALVACQGLGGPAPSPETPLDEAFFRCRVQPVLTKNCATLACHGDGARPFVVFARNRLRLGGSEADRNAFLGDDERAYNFRSAAAMVDADRPDESPLLMKPLATAAGGWFHGATRLEGGQDVFDEREGEWTVLSDWAHGATDDSDCIEPGSDL
jgi:hypothetical protein